MDEYGPRLRKLEGKKALRAIEGQQTCAYDQLKKDFNIQSDEEDEPPYLPSAKIFAEMLEMRKVQRQYAETIKELDKKVADLRKDLACRFISGERRKELGDALEAQIAHRKEARTTLFEIMAKQVEMAERKKQLEAQEAVELVEKQENWGAPFIGPLNRPEPNILGPTRPMLRKRPVPPVVPPPQPAGATGGVEPTPPVSPKLHPFRMPSLKRLMEQGYLPKERKYN
ncbi:uncharacterized protein LOC129706104 [Leucoraja erinacea]|uniref:uncharacterized protein LOC129706104 n=1 Tax=Leucoraja erinaceus TaxID=7782 RepID=UPI0024555C61|nr:uncharacterized protein LOC129706104 [Leucoraja erinacea]